MKLTQTNPLIVTHKGFTGIQQSSSQVGPVSMNSGGKELSGMKGAAGASQHQADKFKKSGVITELEIAEAISKQASKTITKQEYSGGFRIPQESLNKPYMKNKGGKVAMAAAAGATTTTTGATPILRQKINLEDQPYSKDEIFSRLGLSGAAQTPNIAGAPGSGLVSAPLSERKSAATGGAGAGITSNSGVVSPSVNTTGLQRQQNAQEVQNMSSQDILSQAEQKLKEIRGRKDTLSKKREAEELRERNRKEKLIVQDENTLEEVFVTLDEHKIKMVKSFLKQIELKDKLKDLKLMTAMKEQEMHMLMNPGKKLNTQESTKSELTQDEMNKDLRVIAFLKENSVFKVERKKVQDAWAAYKTLLKKEFDLNEFLSPNEERAQKNNSIAVSAENPFRMMTSSRAAYDILLEKLASVILAIEAKAKVFSSHDSKKKQAVFEVRLDTITSTLNSHKVVADVLGYSQKEIEALFGGSDFDDTLSVSELKTALRELAGAKYAIADAEIKEAMKVFEEQEKSLEKEFAQGNRLKELENEIILARDEIRANDMEPFTDEEIKDIIYKQENPNSFGRLPDQEALTLQAKLILKYKEITQLDKDIREQRASRKLAEKGEKIAFTVPEPYSFNERDRVEEVSNESGDADSAESDDGDDDDKKAKKYMFRAKKVPGHVKNLHLFEQIMAQNEKRREDIKRKSMQLTKQNEKPFSFYKRAQSSKRDDRRPYWETDIVEFRATEVPNHVGEILLEKMNAKAKAKRLARVEARMDMLKRISSLPPRMAEHAENERVRKALMRQYDEDNQDGKKKGGKHDASNPFFSYTFQPDKARKVPNFQKLHSTLQASLDAQKQGFKPTEIDPFKFSETKRAPPMDYMDYENVQARATMDLAYSSRKKQKKGSQTINPAYLPQSTKKASGIQNYRKEQQEIKAKKAKEEVDARQEREEKRNKLKERFYSSKALVDDTEGRARREVELKEQRAKERRQTMNEMTMFYSSIQANLDSKPLLIEKYDKDHTAVEKATQKWSLKTGNPAMTRSIMLGSGSAGIQSMGTLSKIM